MQVGGSCVTGVQCDSSTVLQGYRGAVLQGDSSTGVQCDSVTVLQIIEGLTYVNFEKLSG